MSEQARRPEQRRRSISPWSLVGLEPTASTRLRPFSSASTLRTGSRHTRRVTRGEGFEDDVIVRAALERPSAVGLQSGVERHAREGDPCRSWARRWSLMCVRSSPCNDPCQAALQGAAVPARVRLGADVPFFLEPGPKLAEGVGEVLTPLRLPQDLV